MSGFYGISSRSFFFLTLMDFCYIPEKVLALSHISHPVSFLQGWIRSLPASFLSDFCWWYLVFVVGRQFMSLVETLVSPIRMQFGASFLHFQPSLLLICLGKQERMAQSTWVTSCIGLNNGHLRGVPGSWCWSVPLLTTVVIWGLRRKKS